MQYLNLLSISDFSQIDWAIIVSPKNVFVLLLFLILMELVLFEGGMRISIITSYAVMTRKPNNIPKIHEKWPYFTKSFLARFFLLGLDGAISKRTIVFNFIIKIVLSILLILWIVYIWVTILPLSIIFRVCGFPIIFLMLIRGILVRPDFSK